MDMRCYTALLSAVPAESADVPLLLHCMLEQVSLTLAAALWFAVSGG